MLEPPTDQNDDVRKSASEIHPTRTEKRRDFAIGCLGWPVLNLLVWYIILNYLPSGEVLRPVVLLLNILALGILAAKRPSIALGAVVAFAVVLAIVVALMMLLYVSCRSGIR